MPEGSTALFAYAKRAILAGEELTIDYGQGQGAGRKQGKTRGGQK